MKGRTVRVEFGGWYNFPGDVPYIETSEVLTSTTFDAYFPISDALLFFSSYFSASVV
jgi:hypothetical protein